MTLFLVEAVAESGVFNVPKNLFTSIFLKNINSTFNQLLISYESSIFRKVAGLKRNCSSFRRLVLRDYGNFWQFGHYFCLF